MQVLRLVNFDLLKEVSILPYLVLSFLRSESAGKITSRSILPEVG